eukprot:Opistho-1_new@39211
MKKDPLLFLHTIAQTIFDKKGINILGLDVRGISTLTDYMIIAEGMVDRHVISIADEVQHVLKKVEEVPLHTEGMREGDWVVLDYEEVMIHLFMPGLREKYQLERLWSQGTLIDLKIEVPEKNASSQN